MPAYTEFDSNKPDGTVGTGTSFAADLLANMRSGARDLAMLGRIPGFLMSSAIGAGPDSSRPQFRYFMNNTLSIGFRLSTTWGGTNSVQPTQVQWAWSAAGDYNANPASATWTNMGSAQVNTFDGADNITATTNSGGWFTWFLELVAKFFRVKVAYDAHAAATGTAVHGLGTMSTQAASAVAVTGGTINGASFGATTPANVDSTRVREAFISYASIGAGATVTMQCDLASHFYFQPHATTSSTMTVAVSGVGASGKSQTIIFEIGNGRRDADARITWPASFRWVGGAAFRPVDTALELAGRNLFTATTRDGGVNWDVLHLGKGG